MLFNSVHFLLFCPIALGLYFALPHRLRWLWLLLASCYFYMAFVPQFVVILFVLILVDYYAGIWIEQSEGRRRRTYLVLSIVANIGILGFFKYFNFFNSNLTELFAYFGMKYPIPNLGVILPIGLSFHTFQSMSYTIEVYRGRQKAERHLGIYALYVLFWPQLVAGPIERPQNLLPQLHTPHVFVSERARAGAQLMFLGFCKKVLVADSLSGIVGQVYADPSAHPGLTLILATYCFALQIYCDFSGYTDIARGVAKIMGYDLMQNFARPYLADSIAEFWKRWHISLSTWFRDYLYIPLGGNRGSLSRTCLNLFFVFLVSGFWHGANWTFLVWGGLHGIFLITANLSKRAWARPNPVGWARPLHIFITFNLVSFSWIFFRAESMPKANYIASHLFSGIATASWAQLSIAASDLWMATGAFVVFVILDLVEGGMQPAAHTAPRAPAKWHFVRQTAARVAAIAAIVVVLLRITDQSAQPQQFIYFQF